MEGDQGEASGKKEVCASSFADVMILSINNPTISIRKLLQLIKHFQQSSRNMQKSVAFLYTKNKQTEKESGKQYLSQQPPKIYLGATILCFLQKQFSYCDELHIQFITLTISGMRTLALLYFHHHLHLLLQLLNNNSHPSSFQPTQRWHTVCVYLCHCCVFLHKHNHTELVLLYRVCPLALKGHICCDVYQNFFIIHTQQSAVGRGPVLLTHSFAHHHWDVCTFHPLATVNYAAININMG